MEIEDWLESCHKDPLTKATSDGICTMVSQTSVEAELDKPGISGDVSDETFFLERTLEKI